MCIRDRVSTVSSQGLGEFSEVGGNSPPTKPVEKTLGICQNFLSLVDGLSDFED